MLGSNRTLPSAHVSVHTLVFPQDIGKHSATVVFVFYRGPNVQRPRIYHYTEGTYLILRVLDYIVTISFGRILNCGCFNLFCNVWVCVCVGFVMCVLAISVLVFTVFCNVYMVFLFRLCKFILICFV